MTRERILVVDDQSHIVRILKRALMQSGYVVDVAANGVDALEYLQAATYVAVVTDYQMPRMDGIELCETFREQDPAGETLLILSTAIADQSLEQWANNLANTVYLEKPVSFERLTDILSEYIEEKHQAQGTSQAR